MRRLSIYIAVSIAAHAVLLITVSLLLHWHGPASPPDTYIAFDIVPLQEEPTQDQVETDRSPERPADVQAAAGETAPPTTSPPAPTPDAVTQSPTAEPPEPAREAAEGIDFRAHRPMAAYLGSPSRALPGPPASGAQGTGGGLGPGQLGPGPDPSGSFVPEALLLPLAVTLEGAAFYAAYEADNKPAMAAVAGLAVVKGDVGHSLKKAVRGATGGRDEGADLSAITSRDLDILCALWGRGPIDVGTLYLALPEGWTLPDLREALKRMKKAHLIVLRGKGSNVICRTPVDRRRVLRALSARSETPQSDLVRLASPAPDPSRPDSALSSTPPE